MALAFQAGANTLHLRVPENGTIEDLSKQTKEPLARETDLTMQINSPRVVKIEGRIPVLVVPTDSGDSVIKLNPPFEKEVSSKASQKDISFSVSQIMVGIESIQKSIQKKNYESANSQLEDLEKKFPDVAFLGFVRGSLDLIQGQKSKARKAVLHALESHPDYKEGQEFLKALGGPEKEAGKGE